MIFHDSAEWREPSPSTDDYGNATDGWTEPAGGWPTIPVWIQPIGGGGSFATSETREGRDTITARFLMLTSELNVTARAKIVHQGRTYEIDGLPMVIGNRLGPHHLEAALLFVEG